MSEVILADVELECCRKLADCFHRGEITWRANNDWEKIGLTPSNYIQVLSTLARYGYIANVQATNASPFRSFTIQASVVQVVRQLEEKQKKEREGKDIVESVKLTLRKHPIVGWALVAFVVINAALGFANLVFAFAKNVKETWGH